MRVGVPTGTSLVWCGGRRRCRPSTGIGRVSTTPSWRRRHRAHGRIKRLLSQGRVDGCHERHRVYGRGRGVITEVNLVVDVGSGGMAAAAGDADDVAGVDVLSFVDVR